MPAGVNLVTLVLKPATRLLVGVLTIPMVRAVRRQVPGWQEIDAETEKDVEQWFRGTILLLLAMKNTETWLSGWLTQILEVGSSAIASTEIDLNQWWITAGRLLLAIGVIESMPDQELFSIIHPGPRLQFLRGRSVRENVRAQCGPCLRGLACLHLKRSSPMFAILTVFFGGPIGWVFYGMAIVQYLIIGLVTSRDRALDVLSQFDRAVAERRQEILDEFRPPEPDADLELTTTLPSPPSPPPSVPDASPP